MDRQNKPVRRNDLVWREVDGEIVIISPDNRSMHTLNDVGSRIWTLIDGDTDVDAIAAILGSEFNGDHEDIKRDVHEYLSSLRQLNLLEE
ncbi:MAG: pyrroloquinoline quinone biosynthesis peptide chaperone PqqD [Deferribacteres bacterium]|nr:pyrroloquinoline quinone biosynthesis peptide chaperone PqqD [Deferribacteres bacterium]